MNCDSRKNEEDQQCSLCQTVVRYEKFGSSSQIESIVELVQKDLSEPYSIYTYRYFVYQWPDLCNLAYDKDKLIGVIICKFTKSSGTGEGYIAMLAVSQKYRRMGVGEKLVTLSLETMKELNVSKVLLETNVENYKALSLYQKLGFYREKYCPSYYFDGSSAFVLRLNLT